MLPLVALVGRPNVGKSTLFNALTRTRDALVHDQPGVTRDRNYGVCRPEGQRPFAVVDTGGIAGEDEGLAGATAARPAPRRRKPTWCCSSSMAAKAHPRSTTTSCAGCARPRGRRCWSSTRPTGWTNAALADFARYGFSAMSRRCPSAHRQGIDDLIDEVLEELPEEGATAQLDTDPSRIRVAFIGRPNVGKSTLVNRLLGEERMIASEVPGTTRDSVVGRHGARRPPVPPGRHRRRAPQVARSRKRWRSSRSSRPCRRSSSARSPW